MNRPVECYSYECSELYAMAMKAAAQVQAASFPSKLVHRPAFAAELRAAAQYLNDLADKSLITAEYVNPGDKIRK